MKCLPFERAIKCAFFLILLCMQGITKSNRSGLTKEFQLNKKALVVIKLDDLAMY